MKVEVLDQHNAFVFSKQLYEENNTKSLLERKAYSAYFGQVTLNFLVYLYESYIFVFQKLRAMTESVLLEGIAIEVQCDLLLKLFVSQAFCEEGNITENGVLAFCKYVLFPVMEVKAKAGKLISL